ncbi:uncharacterized protein [Dysidea avara]|uniref:uncharacterized protein n=1 Tax=Dysidea avara TaxID=196820 RepID=UPI00332FF6AA
MYCAMNYTGSSCLNIYNKHPETGDKPGYYRMNNNQWIYCNMTAVANGYISTCAGIGGGWTRIANIDTNAGHGCPSGWQTGIQSGVNFCRQPDSTHCVSAYFYTNGTSYQRVCGRARGYQKGATVAFYYGNHGGHSRTSYYADGLLITRSSSYEHVWSYVAGYFDNHTQSSFNCPCAVGSGPTSPTFVDTNFYCESGAADVIDYTAYYLNDPLWDRSGCFTSDCCNNPLQPWFFRQLSGVTSDYIQARICTGWNFGSSGILIDQLELYIQ